MSVTGLPARPPVSTPPELRAAPDVEAQRARAALQPGLGVRGLILVVPVAVLIAVGAGPDGSTRVLGPLVTYALPLVVMVAFWWENWPGTRLRASWSGWADTLLVAAGGVVLAGAGQAIAGGLDLRGLFSASPGPGHVPTFPATLPLGAAVFVAMLQLTLVGEGWPLRRLPGIQAGLLALAAAWATGLVIYAALADVPAPPRSGVAVRHGPVPGVELGAALVVVSAFQVLLSVLWHGWPLAGIASRRRRLACAHLAVGGAGIGAYALAHSALAVGALRLTALTGCFVAAGLLIGMLMEGWLERMLSPGRERAVTLLAAVALAAALALALYAVAAAVSLTGATADEWVAHAGLDALAVSTILHVAVGRRWPFLRAGAGRAGADGAL